MIHTIGMKMNPNRSLGVAPPAGRVGAYCIRLSRRPRGMDPRAGYMWGVCNTSLQPGTYDPSKYRCDSPTGYGWPFKKQSRFRPSRDRGVGRMRYAPTTGYVRSFEILTQCPNRVCAILRNTDAIPQPDTRDPSKYRWDLSTGGAGVLGRWGDGGYRLRGRRV